MDYVANCPISMPIDSGVIADADFGGLMFSYQYGPVYVIKTDDPQLRGPRGL